MRVCIDSNQFIFGIAGTDPAAEMVLNLVPDEFLRLYVRLRDA